MKTKSLLILTLAAAGVFACLTADTIMAKDKAPSKELLAKAKVTRAKAEKTALAAVPNSTVKDAELEEEDGGLRWSFDLTTPGSKKITEVGVDAITGKIIENKVESEKDEAKEKDGDKDKKGKDKDKD